MSNPHKIALLTDSTADLPPAMRAGKPIYVVPLKILCGDGDYSDGVDIFAGDIYDRLHRGEVPRTSLPEGGVGLDIGCGSGALTIACAKRNPQGKMIGIDRWGKEYASFSLPLCEKNAAAEGVKNASFQRGNAVKLDFPDESFDAVTSNYVYHNIAGKDKQALLLETLRVLKKGGTFAIHDLMSPGRYGDMQAFVQKLRDMGYERVELMDTTDGSFMTPKEAKRLMLRGSTLLVGRK